MAELIYKDESYTIIGKCMEVHNQLGGGFLEEVYKDALEIDFNDGVVPFRREVGNKLISKNRLLKHNFYADFVVMEKIILEVKAVKQLTDEHRAQALNYLAASKCKLALLINFGKGKLTYERLVL